MRGMRSGPEIGRQIVEMIRKYERGSGFRLSGLSDPEPPENRQCSDCKKFKMWPDGFSQCKRNNRRVCWSCAWGEFHKEFVCFSRDKWRQTKSGTWKRRKAGK